jgi:glycosyltransferase involved in cell wall biosynthesis
MKTLRILGTRGIPAAHGGFETFAEHLALYLQDKGWRVVVYCQEHGPKEIRRDTWRGIERILISVPGDGVASTMHFDWLSIQDAARTKDLCLTLGYNTAIFNTWLRLKGVPNVFNMDGIEWVRAKWGPVAKTWFWMNDWLACWLGQHLVADHPAIRTHLLTRVRSNKITMIPYGAVPVEDAPTKPIHALGLQPGRYLTVIARPEPENSLLEIVSAFSRKSRGYQLAVLGNYSINEPYHQAVRRAAGSEVCFLGAIYDAPTVQALRFHCAGYLHGHQVGGTNPSLVEALGAGNPVIAHDNPFNRWVAGENALYFDSVDQLSAQLDTLLNDSRQLPRMQSASRLRFREALTWPIVLEQYETLLERFLPSKNVPLLDACPNVCPPASKAPETRAGGK